MYLPSACTLSHPRPILQCPLFLHGQTFHSPEGEKLSGNETKCPHALKPPYINILIGMFHTANSIRNINKNKKKTLKM